jgi:acyl-CoA synthetase (NDP forming)
MLSASDVTVDALFRQAGVVRVDTLAELLDVATMLANQPLPAGRRVGIVTNVGGPGIMCADACQAHGLEIPELSEALRSKLAGTLPAAASLTNPVDVLATATAEQFQATIETVAGSGEVDAVIAIFIPPLLGTSGDVVEALRDALAEVPEGIPAQAVLMSEREHSQLAGGPLPAHRFPEDAARALARAVQYREWREAPSGPAPEPDARRTTEGATVIADALSRGEGWLEPGETARLLAAYDIPHAAWREAADPNAAGRAAEEIGGPVALKATGGDILHKSDLGAVRLGLQGASEVVAAAREMDEALTKAGHHPDALIVQEMVEGGSELLIGVVGDPLFGPVLACGAGGVQTELLKDVAIRLTPLTEVEAAGMLRSLRTFPLLEGYRGAPAADIASIERLLLTVSMLAEAHHEIAELDLNPVIAGPDGAVVVDARVRVEARAPEQPWPSV